MKINLDKNLIEFLPESPSEKAKIETIWRLLVDCNGTSLKLSPVGEYVPEKNGKGACFFIEGLDENISADLEIRLPMDCKVYCMQCNKLLDLKKGDKIPVCCGKVMEVID